MREMEQIIRENGRQQLYDYYRSLGYAHKTAASLALFTYGRYRFRNLSMDDLYDALLEGREYIPQEVIEQRKRLEREAREREERRRQEREARAQQERSEHRIRDRRERSVDRSRRIMACRIDDSVELAESAPVSRRRPSAPAAKRSPSGGLADCCVSLETSVSMDSSILGIAGAAGFSTDEYEPIEEKDARTTLAAPTSTFRMTTNTASAGVILNQLRNGRRIDRSMVRIEEMLNYFRYESESPENEMFGMSCELMDTDNDRKYLYINVQGREEVRDRQNIIILLDVSGSMSSNTEQTQAIVATIISKLGSGDKLSLVTYSTKDNVELEAFTINGPEDRIRALEKFLTIQINGCTYGSAGIGRAYEIGKKNYIDGGNNQVILITDGDLNFGITDKGGLEELIARKKKDNLFLSVIGTGLYNYKDDKLETLCKHGNGVYRVVNNLADVRKNIDEEYSSLVNIIAKDVKAQVEFNPELVEAYRLLGFENRALAHEDFTNDKVISEPFGSGGYGVALYELKMKTGTAPAESGLKYSKLVTTGSQEVGTVKVRYKEPLDDVSHELEKVIETAEASYTDNLRLAFIVYVCAEKLRGSDKISTEEINLAQKLYQELGTTIREKNAADLYKLAGILDKSEKELGIGIQEEKPFIW